MKDVKDWEQLQIRAFSKMRYASNTGSARRRSGGMRTMVAMVAALPTLKATSRGPPENLLETS